MIKNLFTFLLAILISIAANAEIASGTCGSGTWSLSDNGVLYITGGMGDYNAPYGIRAPWYKYNKQITSVNIGEGVLRIGSEAFEFLDNLTSVSLPNTVVSIGDYAFGACPRLASIILPNSITELGAWAFDGCSTLRSITLSGSLKEIKRGTFRDCISLSAIIIPSSVTTIEDGTFEGCSSLTSVTIPNSVTSIEYSAFEDCSSLTTVNYGGTKAEWEAITIDYSNDPLLNANITFTSSQGEWTVLGCQVCYNPHVSNLSIIYIENLLVHNTLS